MLVPRPCSSGIALQVVESKVHAFVCTHGPKLREISRHARPISSPTPGAKSTSSYHRGASAPSKARSHHSSAQQSSISSIPIPHARIPGQLLSVEESSRRHGTERPYTAGATVQSNPRNAPSDALMNSLVDSTSCQRRVRCASCILL